MNNTKTTTIALILGLNSPFYLSIAQGAKTAAAALDVTLIVDAPTTFDAALQASIVDTYVMRKVDAIIIAPCDDQVLIAPLQRADEAGIKVFTVDAYIGNGDYVRGPVTFPLSNIASDNILGGKLGAEALLKRLESSGTVHIQSTLPGLSATDLRETGFKEALAQQEGTMTLAGINYDGCSIEVSAEQTVQTLQKYPALAGIFSTGDYSTRGVVQALKQEHKVGQVSVVRFDASQQAIEDLRADIIDAVIAQMPQEMGRIAVDYAIRALNGQLADIEKQVKTGLLLIDRSNVDTPEAQALVY